MANNFLESGILNNILSPEISVTILQMQSDYSLSMSVQYFALTFCEVTLSRWDLEELYTSPQMTPGVRFSKAPVTFRGPY